MPMLLKSVRKLWNEWELRVMVLISLCFQIILIMLANRRKYSTRYSLRIVVWLAYMGADWVATVALGVLCYRQGDFESNGNALHPDNIIMALWAPFLLMHLGGPDTITAYSLEDNELWLRHLLGLLVQVSVAFYVFIRSLTTGIYHLIFLAIPLFLAGIIKYGERTLALWSASSEHFRESLLPPPNAGLDYEKLVRFSREAQVYGRSVFLCPGNREREVDPNIIPDAKIFHEAYAFFKIFRRLYVDLIFNVSQIRSSSRILSQKKPEDAFQCIELELGYMYDVLHTKAPLLYFLPGCYLRPISFISTVSAFAGFLIVDKKGYSFVNIIISYILLVGAIVLEMYAFIILLSSDWAMLWLRKHKRPQQNLLNQAISILHSAINAKNKWSHSVSQFNLIGFCLRSKLTNFLGILKIFGMYEKLEKHQQTSLKNVPTDLKHCVFQHLLQKVQSLEGSFEGRIKLCSWKGDQVLTKFKSFDKLGWSIEVEFDESILLWHIATDLCFNTFPHKTDREETSKLLSDYMLYLLVKRPFMLPKGIGQIRFQDTVAEATRFFRGRSITCSMEACTKLLEVDSQIPETEIKGDACKSVLFNGCRLAKSLQELEKEERWHGEDIWEMITDVWVEMLCYAANQCGWNQHAQQLRQGGELLTHVSLLMTHLGLTEQLKIIKGGY